MSAATYRYFARGHTARGDHTLYASAFSGLQTVYMLQGFPGMGKSALLAKLSKTATNNGWDVQQFHSAMNPGEVDGLIITDLKTGFVDGSAAGELQLTGADVVKVDMRHALREDRIAGADRALLTQWETALADELSAAYTAFAEALAIHDEWESFYIENMDLRKADELARSLTQSMMAGRSLAKTAAVRHLFLGAATPDGPVDYIQNLTNKVKQRIFIKGRPGTGKSTLLKQLAAHAEASGFDVDVFHCGFDPNSLDMLIFPELSIAIFDSTAPHEHDPDRDSDTVLDMYAQLVAPGIDERYAEELDAIKTRYSERMNKATSHLAKARGYDAQIKAIYAAATDASAINRIYNRLAETIAYGPAPARAD